jgi:hypothetical protein
MKRFRAFDTDTTAYFRCCLVFYVSAIRSGPDEALITFNNVMKCAHRDVAARNILITDSGAKLADFARWTPCSDSRMDSVVGAQSGDKLISASSDVFLLLEDLIGMFNGYFPDTIDVYLKGIRTHIRQSGVVTPQDFFHDAKNPLWDPDHLLSGFSANLVERWTVSGKLDYPAIYSSFWDIYSEALAAPPPQVQNY